MESIAGRVCLPAPLLQSLSFDRYPRLLTSESVDRPIRIPFDSFVQQMPSLQNLAFFTALPPQIISLPGLQNLTGLQWIDRKSTALRYVCQDLVRPWNFAFTSGDLTIHETPQSIPRNPPADRWLPPNTPISFRRIVEGFSGYPLPGNIPIEQFESLESIRPAGEVDTLHHIMRPTGKTSSDTLLVPFLSHLEFHSTVDGRDFPFEVLTEILRERKEASHGVKAVRVTGEYGECSSEEVSKLVKFVDALILD